MKLKVGIFIAVILSALFLLSCDKSGDTELKNGIEIEEDAPYSPSEEVRQRAENSIFTLVKGYYQKTATESLPDNTISKIKTESGKIRALTEKYPLTEKQYTDFIACLEKNTDIIIDVCAAEEADPSKMKALYKELSAVSSEEYVGNTAYNLLLYYYDYKYNESMDRYSSYGYSFLLEDAEKFKADKSVLENEIGADSFLEATEMFFFFSELFCGGAHESDALSIFTDEEILVLLKSIHFNLDNVTENGYKLLLSYIPSQESGGYIQRLFHKTKENGDITVIAAKMKSMLSLLSVCQESLTEKDSEYIRNGDTSGLISSLLESFDSEDFALFEDVTSMSLKNGDYNAVATEIYGENYTKYLSSVETCTLDGLKAAGGENRLKALKGYIAGVCPALAYLIDHD